MTRMMFRLMNCLAILVALASTAQAVESETVIHEIGFTDRLVAHINEGEQTWPYGGIAVDSAGNIFSTAGSAGSNGVVRIATDGSVETFATLPSGTPLGLELVGTMLYASTNLGDIFRLDTTHSSPAPMLWASIGEEDAMDLATTHSFPGKLMVAGETNVYAVDLDTGASSAVLPARTGGLAFSALAGGGGGCQCQCC